MMEKSSPIDALLNSKALKEEGNKFSKLKAFRCVINMCEESL